MLSKADLKDLKTKISVWFKFFLCNLNIIAIFLYLNLIMLCSSISDYNHFLKAQATKDKRSRLMWSLWLIPKRKSLKRIQSKTGYIHIVIFSNWTFEMWWHQTSVIIRWSLYLRWLLHFSVNVIALIVLQIYKIKTSSFLLKKIKILKNVQMFNKYKHISCWYWITKFSIFWIVKIFWTNNASSKKLKRI